MSRHRNPAPSYVPHKQSGRGRLVWTDHLGNRHQKLLPGLFGSAESLAAKARLELATTFRQTATTRSVVSVNEVLLAFLIYAEGHYRRADGSNTNEFEEYKLVCRYVRELYGERPATEFGPLSLKAVRQRFIDAGWSRGFINQRVGRIRRVMKWAVAEELVPPTVHQALSAVSGLQRGRSKARESRPVEPVADGRVDAVLQHLNRHARGLVEFQRVTGSEGRSAVRKLMPTIRCPGRPRTIAVRIIVNTADGANAPPPDGSRRAGGILGGRFRETLGRSILSPCWRVS